MAEETKPKQRTVKKVETVREKAVKAQEDSKQPRRLHTTKRRAAAPFRVIGKAFKKLGSYKVFRVIGLIIVPPYFRNSWRELRQVTWPTLKVSTRLTFAVIVFATVFGVLIAVVDYGLDKVFKEVLLK